MAASQYSVRVNAEGMDAFIADMQRGGAGTDALANASTRLVGVLPSVSTGLGRMQDEARKTTEALRAFGTSKDTATASSGRLTQALGQAGFQVQDFTVQVAGGQNALLAFAQQGSQLAGVFGPAGAMAGAALAIGAIAAMLLTGKSSADAFADAIKAQGESFKEATEAAERWREGLSKEAEQVVNLRAYYSSLSQERQGYELRQLDRQREELNRQTDALKTRVERPLGGLVNTAQLDQAAAAAAGLPADQRELYLSNPDLQRMRDAVEVLKSFRAEGTVTEDSLAQLSARFRELAGDSGDAFSRRLRTAAEELEKNGPQARQLSEAVQQLDGRFRGLNGELSETETRLRALRAASAANPLSGLNTEAATLDARLQALRGGGLAALERVQTEQEKLTEITRRATAAEEAHAKSLAASSMSASDAAAAARRMQPEFLAAATRVVETNALLVEGKKKAEEAERAARSAARAGASASRRDERADEREAERFDLTHYSTPVINPASGLLSFGGDDDRTQAQIRRNVDVAERATQRNAEIQRRALETQERAAERSTDSVVRYAGDAFADLFEKNTKGWAGFLDTIESTAKKTFARVAAEAVIRPIVSPLVAGLTGSGGGSLYGGLANTFGFGQVAGLFGGFGGSSSSSGSSSQSAAVYGQGGATARAAIGGGAGTVATGGGGGVSLQDAGGGLYKIVNSGSGGGVGSSLVPSGITNFLNTPIYTTELGMAATAPLGAGVQGPVASITDPGMGMTVGSTIGAGASIAGGAYGVYQGVQRGGVGGYTQAAGGAVSIASGAVAAGVGTGLIGASSTLAMLGPYGMVAAAVLAIIGALLPGEKPSNRTGSASIDLMTGAQTSFGQTGDKFSAENRASATTLAGGVKQLTDSISKLTGTAAQGSVVVDVGGRDGLGLAVSTPQGLRAGYKFNSDEAGQAELMRTVSAHVLDEMSTRMPYAVARAVEGVQRDSTENILTALAKIADATNGGAPSANQNIAAANIDFGRGNLDAGIADLKWAATTYDSLTGPKTNPFEKQMNELAAAWQVSIDRAARLGLATDNLATALDAARAEAVKAQSDAIRGLLDPMLARNQIATTGNQFDAQIFLADRQRELEGENMRAQLEALGMGGGDIAARLEQLRSTQGAERSATYASRDATFANLVGNVSLRGSAARGDSNASLLAFDFNAANESKAFADQLRSLGASAQTVAEQMAALGDVQRTERENLTEQLGAQAKAAAAAADAQRNATARNVLEQLAIGQLGGLTGETRYFAGMQSLNAAQRGLATGGAEGVAEYARVAQLVLPVLRDFLGTSERYGAITADVAGNLSQYAPGGDVANLATLIEAQTVGADQLTSTLLSTSGVTNDLLGRIQSDISRLTGQIAAVMARAA